MPKQQRKSKKTRRVNRVRKLRGGGQGSGWTPGGALNPGLPNGLSVNQSYDACLGAQRPGQMAFSATGGLAGMRGGAYTNVMPSDNSLAGFTEISKLPCTPNQRGGVGLQAASASPVLTEVGARYTTAPSQFTNSVGAPILINQPLSGAAWSKACTQTAGRRHNKKSKKTRKARK